MRNRKPPPNQVPDPTPEQIREICLQIQAGWSDAEERDRRCFTFARNTNRRLSVQGGPSWHPPRVGGHHLVPYLRETQEE